MHSRINFLSSSTSIQATTKITLLLTLIGLAQGLTFSFAVIFSYIYLETYLLSPAQATFLDLFIQLPWIFRPVGIALTSYFKPFGYQKKSFLIMTSFVGFLALIGFTQLPVDLPIGGLMLFLVGLSLCFLNCLVEEIIYKGVQGMNSLRISEYEKQKQTSKNSTIFFVTKYIGKIIGAVLMTLHLQEKNKESFLIGTSLCLLLTGIVSFKFPEKRITNSRKSTSVQLVDKTTMETPETGMYMTPGDQSISQSTAASSNNSQSMSYGSLKESISFMKKPTILLCISIILLSGISLQSHQTKFYFYTQQLDFAPDFMGFLKLIECISILLAMCVYYGFLTKINLKTLYKVTLIFTSILLLTELIIILGINSNLGLSNSFFAFLLALSQGLATELKSFPILLLAKGICPKVLEPLLLAILVSIGDIGNLISALLGGLFTSLLGIETDNFSNLWILSLIGAIFSLSPLLIIRKLDVDRAFGEAEALENSWTQSTIINDPTSLTELDNTIAEGKTYEILEI